MQDHSLEGEEAFLERLREAIGHSSANPEIEGFRVHQRVAAGSQGSVYMASRNSNGEKVAIKVFDKQLFTSPDLARRLHREIRLVQRLDHPGIVKVFESGVTHTGHPFIVMEFLDGAPLASSIPLGRKDGVFQDIHHLLRVFRSICAAIDHAHKRGVLHRDLKPGNIMMASQGEPTVTDFGLAKDLGPHSTIDSHEGLHLTQTGLFLGSLAYAAPEQIGLAPGDIDIRSDVYSLGVILFQLLTGKLPLDTTGDRLDILNRLQASSAPSPSKALKRIRTEGKLAPGAPTRLPRDLDTVVVKSLSYQKQDRYQSVEEFSADIARVLAKEPVRAGNEALPSILMRTALKHRIASISFVLALLFVALFSVQSFHRAGERGRLYSWALASQEILLSDALSSIGKLVGAAETEENLIRSALISFDNILKEYPGDLALRAGRARCLVMYGSKLRERGQPNQAMQNFLSARKEYQELCQGRRANPTWKHGLSICLVKIGDLHKESARIDLALSHYRQALEIDKELVDQAPHSFDFVDNLFWSHQRLGSIALDSKDFDSSDKHFAKLFPLSEQLKAIATEGQTTISQSVARHKAKAALALAGNDLNSAVSHHLAAIKEIRQDWDLSSNSAQRQHELAWALITLSSIEQMKGNIEESNHRLAEAIQIAEMLITSEPQSIDFVHLNIITQLKALEAYAETPPNPGFLGRTTRSIVQLFPKTSDRPDQVVAHISQLAGPLQALSEHGHGELAMQLALPPLRALVQIPELPEFWLGRTSKFMSSCNDLVRLKPVSGPEQERLLSEIESLVAQFNS